MKNLYLIILLTSYLTTNTIYPQNIDETVSKTTIGGYGELHYNNEVVANQSTKTMLDFHRFVLFFSHNWNEKWSFKSEVELEHNFVQSGQGELELEQAYVNYHLDDYLGFQFGVVLPSVGFINELHEPPLFFGVERPEYHNRIIPTTWYGNGAAIYGNYFGIDYKLTIMEGLDSDKFSAASGIRSGRQKGFKPKADRLLYNLRIDYLNITDLRFGASYTYNDSRGDSTHIPVKILELHSRYQANNIYIIFEIAKINYTNWNVASSFGYYFDIGYKLSDFFDWEINVIPFFRYSDTNTAFEVNNNSDQEKLFHLKQWMFGLSIFPIDEVVFKVDYSVRKRIFDNQETKLFNIGVGYMF